MIEGGPRRVSVAAYAKINLALDLLRVRPDGYTEIATVFQTIGLADAVEVELEPAGSGAELEVVGPAPCPPEQNLALRAARAFVEQFRTPGRIRIRLEKKIPAGAGLGGGSADGAAVLRGLQRLTGIPVAGSELARVAARLGADIPYFLTGGLAIGRGRGDEIEPLADPPSWPVVLAQAGRQLDTAEVYRLARSRLTARNDAPNIQRLLRRLREAPQELPPVSNGLLPAAGRLEPRIHLSLELLERFGGRAGMTGSGSCVFGLFADDSAAGRAAAALAEEAGAAFVHCTRTLARSELAPPVNPNGA